MPTRQEIIAQVRAAQRQRSLSARAIETKPAIVSIGDRHPQTGLHDVLLPNGSIALGEKQFNSAVPTGSQVLGIPQATGNWLLDERDVVVNPIAPDVAEPKGKIKYLYLKFATDERVLLYVGGWKRQPALVHTFEPGAFVGANLDNLGDDRWRVDTLTLTNGSYHFQTFDSGQASTAIDTPPPGIGFKFYGFGLTWLSYDQQITTDPYDASSGSYTVTQHITTQHVYVVDGVVRQSTGSGVGMTVFRFQASGSLSITFAESGIPLSNHLNYTETFESYADAGGSSDTIYRIALLRSNGAQSIGVLTTDVNSVTMIRPCWIDDSVQPSSVADYDLSGSLDVQKEGFTRFVLDATFPDSKDQVVEVEQYNKMFVKSVKTIKTKVLKPPAGSQPFSPSYHR